jgi:hypothetical protein
MGLAIVVNFTGDAAVMAAAADTVVAVDERPDVVAAFELATIATATLAVVTVTRAIHRNFIADVLRVRSSRRPGATVSNKNEKKATQSSPDISSSAL